MVVFTAEVTGHHPRGHTCQPHQRREAGGVMFAKSHPAMKKEFIEVVVSVFTRRKGKTKTLAAKKLERLANDRLRIRAFGLPGLRQIARGRADCCRRIDQKITLT